MSFGTICARICTDFVSSRIGVHHRRYRRPVPRPLRLQIPGGLYHVTQRATDSETLFVDVFDRAAFDHLLLRTAQRFDWEIHDHCQLTNHFHLLFMTREPNIAQGMQYLNGRYVQAFSARHRRRGTLVQGRYYSGLIQDEAHYVQARAYLALNPVDAGLCDEPAAWRWSGFGAGGKIVPPPDAMLRRLVVDVQARRRALATMAFRDTSGL
jgi:REP-associated tyrosine transposase